MEVNKEETPFVHTKENSTGIVWKASTPLPGQNVFLMSYATNPGGKEGIYAAFKIIGVYPDEEAAEKASIEESKVDFNKQYKLGVVGKWDLMKDPTRLGADKLDKIVDVKGVKNGEVVRQVIATQNVLLKKQEDRDRKEMKEREEKILSEMADDIESDEYKSEEKKEKERFIQYKILNEKVKQNPLFIESAKAQIEELMKDIKRIEEKNAKAIEELETLNKDYPELKVRYLKDEERRRKKKEDEIRKRNAKK